MNIIRYFLLVTCLIGSSISLKAQITPLEKYLVEIIKIDEDLFKSNPNFNNKNFMLFIGIGVNNIGLIDTVIYNEIDVSHDKDQLRQLIDFESTTTAIKKNKKYYTQYKNEFLVLIIYLRRGDDNVVTNPDDLERNFSNLIKVTNQVKHKKVVLLTPWLYSFDTKKITN